MPHHVFTGPFAALEARWLDDVARLQQAAPLRPVPVLVGSNLLASYLKVRVAERGRAVANLRFYTFLDLARHLAQGAASARPRLPALAGATVLDDLLADPVPKVFAAVRSFPGFSENLLDTFRDLRDAGISGPDFEKNVRNAQQVSPDRAEHLKGLAQLYRKFRARTERFTDVDDDFRDAAAGAAHAGKILGSTFLLVYGVYDVTGQQQELLSALKERLELSYYIPFTDADVSGFAEPFVSLCARELRVAAEPLQVSSHQDGLSLLFPGAAGVGLTDDGSFALISVPGESRVAVEIVREALRAIRDGVAEGFYEIAVLLRHAREQAPMLAEALRLRGIPHFIQGGAPFEERPVCRAVMAIAGLSADAFARGSVLRAMELVAAALPPHESREWPVQQWRVLTNDARFLAGVESWNSGTESLVVQCLQDLAAVQEAPSHGDETNKRVLSVPEARYRLAGAQSLRSAWLAVRDAADGWPAALTWSGWAQLLEARLQALLGAADDWNVFSDVLDGIGALDGLSEGRERARVARARFVCCLRESLRDRTLPQGRFLRNGVNLLPIGMARGLRFPVVIVPGLEEGSFPARPRQDALLLDSERKAVGGLYTRLPLKSRRVEEDKLLFDVAVRSAERRLVLLTSRLDESTDRERIPSEFFLRVAETARGSPVTLRDLQEDKIPGFRSVSLENPAPRPGQVPTDAGEIRLRLLTAGEHEARQVIQALARMEPGLLGRSLAFDRARWARDLTPFDGRISDPELARYVAFKAGPAAGQVSPTRMEEYARCPYLFFLKRVIGLQEWEEPEPAEALDPLKRGSAVHSVLERFVREYGGARLATEPRENLQRVLAGLARQELEAAHPPGIPDLLWELECEGVQELLRNWLDFERGRIGAGMEPCAVEHVFGTFAGEEVRPAVCIEAGRHPFEFRGRIDRIDVSPDGRRARVIDYKTGMLPKTMEKPNRPAIMAGERIQIAVYRAAVLASGCWPAAGEIDGEYLHLQPKDKAIVSCAYDNGRLQQGLERLRQILEVVGDGLCTGVFFARSSGTVHNDNCKFCGFKLICGKDVARRDELKSGAPEVARFRRVCAADAAEEQ